MIPIIDGHLDIAMNALLYERDQTAELSALWQRETGGVDDGRGVATLTLPELKDSAVMLVMATVITRCKPWIDPKRIIKRSDLDYPDPAMTYAAAQGQLAYYQQLQCDRQIRIIQTRSQLDAHVEQWLAPGIVQPNLLQETTNLKNVAQCELTPGIIIMMEGADPIVHPQQVHEWYRQGMRCLSLAHFGHSRYAAGTPSPEPTSPEQDGPLTDLGRELLKQMEELNIILDLSHLSDTSFFQAADAYHGPVCATHANCRTIVPGSRQLTDEQIKIIVQRSGIIGIAMHYAMIRPGAGNDLHPDDVTLNHVVEHIDHICQLAGSADCVGIGSDLDGGFGADATPRDLQRYRDLRKLAPALDARGFKEKDVVNLFYNNWLRFFREALPPLT